MLWGTTSEAILLTSARCPGPGPPTGASSDLVLGNCGYVSKARHGPKKAIMAVVASIVTAIYHTCSRKGRRISWERVQGELFDDENEWYQRSGWYRGTKGWRWTEPLFTSDHGQTLSSQALPRFWRC